MTDARGEWSLEVPDGTTGIFWVRVPRATRRARCGRYDGKQDRVDLGLRKLAPRAGPLTFVVAADTHIQTMQQFWGQGDLALASAAATALDPPAAFFTILGDITQGNKPGEFDLVDHTLVGLDVPYIPVPGNHDWYDGGTAWFRHYGPDNYSFDISGRPTSSCGTCR